MKSDKEIICNAFGFDDLRYGRIVMEAGIEWLNHTFRGDAVIVEAASRVGLFWAWWKNQWEIRETTYLNRVPLRRIESHLTNWEHTVALDEWMDIHDPYKLRIQPNKWVRRELIAILDEQIKRELGIINEAEKCR